MPSRRSNNRGKSGSKDRRRRPRMARTRPDRRASGALGDSNFIAHSIENMYRIVEPWQRQGEEVARKFSHPYGSIDMPSGSGDVHGRFLHSGGDLLASWVELLAFYTDWVAGSSGPQRAQGGPTDTPADIAYDIRSRRAIVVHADIDERAHPDDLVARRIRKKNGVRVRFTEDDGRMTVCIEADKNARPGLYASDIVDDYTDEVVGHISIRVR